MRSGSRDLADRRARVVAGEEAQLGAVDRADAGQVALVEQRLAERAVGVGGEPADGLLARPSRGRAGPGRGGRRPRSSCSRSTSSTTPSWKPTAARSARVEDDPGQVAGLAPPLAAVEDPPGALHLEVGVQGPRSPVVGSMRVSRCLPRETRLHDGAAGQVDRRDGGHPEVGAGQGATGQTAWCSLRAVRQTASPSGTGRSPRPQPEPSRRRRRTRRPERRRSGVGPEPRSCSPSAFSTVIRPSAPRRAASRQRMGRRLEGHAVPGVVGPGQQRLAAALDVQREDAVDQHHHARRPCGRGGVPTAPLALGLLRAVGPREARRRTGWRGRWPRGRRPTGLASSGTSAKVRSRSTEPDVPNWAAPRRADEVAAPAATGLLERRRAPCRRRRSRRATRSLTTAPRVTTP